MTWARLLAIVLAGVAVACYGALVIIGAQVGWLFEVGGTAGVPPELLDAREELPWMTVLLATALVASVLAAKRPRHPIPWCLLVAALGFLGYPAVVVTVARGLEGGTIPFWAPYVAWVGNWIWVLGQAGALYLLLLFPDGRPLSARWSVVARLAAAYIAVLFAVLSVWPQLEAAPALDNPFGVEALVGAEGLLFPLLGGGILLQILAIVCIILRFVRSRGVERQQMKWMAFAAGVLGATIPAGMLDAPRWIQAVPFLVLVVAIVVAVTRYRLYDIDRVVSRTVSYAVLSVLLAGIYVIGVVGLGGLVRTVTGGAGGDLVVAGSTLAVAAAFQPLRRRVQRVVDRRFNRARYDARRTVEELASRLREEVDLDLLAASVEQVARSAIQPTQVSLWFARVRS